jgi:transcriptional regulator GlxA family with amidase domain
MSTDIPPRTVLIILPEDSLLFEAVGVADIFHQANQSLPVESRQPRYRVQLASVQRHRVAHGRSGVNLLADAWLGDLDPATGWDTLMVTSRGRTPPEGPAVAPWIAAAAPGCRRVVSVCTGAFHLAQAGLLDGRRATTHWKALDELAKSHPQTKVEGDPIYVQDGKYWTSAGASSGFDLALALVEADLGFAVAREVARYLVLFLRRPGGQSQFSRYLAAQASEPGPIRDVQNWALEHLDADLALDRLADKAAMSPRNFARVFAKQTGTTPARFVEEIRLEAARQRLEQGRETLEQVASACGLGTALTLRRTFERHLGISPSDYRHRFGLI